MKPDLSRYAGKPSGWKPQTELEHFMTCPGCGCVFDCRDLEQVAEHWHDVPDEIVGLNDGLLQASSVSRANDGDPSN